MNKGKLIEQITAIIEDTLQGNEKVKISHDVILKDDTGNDRQIDVLIEYFENERFTFRAIIECKEKGRDGVEINQMHAFASTFRSLPQVQKAIFVSTNGFQSGAINIAKKEGILLYKLEDLKQEDISSWHKKNVNVRKSIKRQEIVNWRVLMHDEDLRILGDYQNFTVSPDEVLHQDSGEKIVIRNLIESIFPYWANRLHNSLLNALIAGHEIDKEKYLDITPFQLKDGVHLIRGEEKIPIRYLELRIMFWVEYEDVEQTIYKLYRDHENKVLADIVSAKVDYSEVGVYLNLVENPSTNDSSYYLLDGKKKKIKLEVEKEYEIPEKGERYIIMKNPK
ncbi:restriction endonuclease [Haliscomenobacter sp.]|uniref:restriction endonuclease n=1 Tax=Haliscomenobacter sp. TaxID=2717303 RepID=UPI003BAB0E3E